MGLETRRAVVAGIAQAQANAAVKAVVITGHGKAFSGGADVREFGSPKAFQEPNLLSVISCVENCSKPVVAALHSVVMGGGLEWHWVVTTAFARPAPASACLRSSWA